MEMEDDHDEEDEVPLAEKTEEERAA